jgi:hypothetical protein
MHTGERGRQQRIGRAPGARRAATGAGGARELAVWSLGLLCGLGTAPASETLLLPFGVALALAGGLPLAWVALRHLLRPRRRVLVWEGPSWRMP